MSERTSRSDAPNDASDKGPTKPAPRRFRLRSRSRGPSSAHKLNLKFLWRTLRLAKPYWFSEEKTKACWLMALLIVLLIGYTEVAVLFNQQSGEFTSALADQDGPRFRRSILMFFGLLVIGVPIDVY